MLQSKDSTLSDKNPEINDPNKAAMTKKQQKECNFRSTMNPGNESREWQTKSNISQLILKDRVLDGSSWKKL